MLLATTALEWTWGEQEPLVFLGEWCRRYEQSARWRARPHVVVRYHWDERRKLRHDYDYLRELHGELLRELARALGELHKLERPSRFWQILLDPWLARYLGIVFDRWENLRVAFAEHDITHTIVTDEARTAPTLDHVAFIDLAIGDEWNHALFADILQQEYSRSCVLHKRAAGVRRDDAGDLQAAIARRQTWKRALVSQIDRVVGWIAPNSDFAFVHSYFPPAALVRLNLALRQMPRLYLREFDWPHERSVPAPRRTEEVIRQLTPQRKAGNRFESFLHCRIAADLPQVLVERFALVCRHAQRIRLRPKVIFTANDHAQNDLFKHWAAHWVHKGVPLVVMEHGGSIPPQFSSMRCETEIADIRTTWTTPIHPRHVRLPTNKLAGRRRTHTPRDRLVVVGQEMPRYAYDALSMPIAGQVLTGLEEIYRLHDALDELPQRSFLVKPYPDLGWSIRRRLVDRLGAGKVTPESRLARVMQRARIVVNTYPQTTFSEAIAFGAVALLVYPRDLYETAPEFDGLVAELQQARMLFFDPVAAAAHIGAIWSDPLGWWNDSLVRTARKRFEEQALDLRDDWVVPWTQFARGLVAETPGIGTLSATPGTAKRELR